MMDWQALAKDGEGGEMIYSVSERLIKWGEELTALWWALSSLRKPAADLILPSVGAEADRVIADLLARQEKAERAAVGDSVSGKDWADRGSDLQRQNAVNYEKAKMPNAKAVGTEPRQDSKESYIGEGNHVRSASGGSYESYVGGESAVGYTDDDSDELDGGRGGVSAVWGSAESLRGAPIGGKALNYRQVSARRLLSGENQSGESRAVETSGVIEDSRWDMGGTMWSGVYSSEAGLVGNLFRESRFADSGYVLSAADIERICESVAESLSESIDIYLQSASMRGVR